MYMKAPGCLLKDNRTSHIAARSVSNKRRLPCERIFFYIALAQLKSNNLRLWRQDSNDEQFIVAESLMVSLQISNGLISDHQFWLPPYHSARQMLLLLSQECLEADNPKQEVRNILLGISQVWDIFSPVPHRHKRPIRWSGKLSLPFLQMIPHYVKQYLIPLTGWQQLHHSLLICNGLVRAHTCMAVRGKKQKNFQTACQKQQPHRPFLRSHVPVRACPYMRGRTCKKNQKNFQTTTQAVPSLS